MIRRKNKKGAEMTMTTIVVIILVLVVLIFSIYSFMKSGGNLMDTISNFVGGGANVDTIKNACQTACTTQSAYAFCEENRTMKTADNKKGVQGSCKTFAKTSLNGVVDCSAITCIEANVPVLNDLSVVQKTCSGTSNKKCSEVSKGSCLAAGCTEPTVSTDTKCIGTIDCTKLTADTKCTDAGCTLA